MTGKDVLTQAEAEARAARVSNVSYGLELKLAKGAASYSAEALIHFDLKGLKGPKRESRLFLDFRGKTVRTLVVNGKALPANLQDCRIPLPAGHLRERNEVRVAYENDFDTTGDGLHRFIDPEDGEDYLYTNFEPFEAHRMLPCFDQPDLKATLRLTVTAPEGWAVIGNAPEEGRDGGVIRFAETKPIAPYLFALIAGPFRSWRAVHKGIPLGLFCRKSIAGHFDPDEVFEITRQGLDFYQAFFDFPYPFGKYDQLFVPEFNAGAMENAAAVTFSERMVFRDPPTESQRRSRAEVILHEMAHMWFGDLVTMTWWNDLWLNESFATYMAYVAMTSSTRFTWAWQDFNTLKNWAYRQDQLVTTHPIAGQVADTAQTLLNFDGITYAKGASSLKQLAHVIGMERFRDGVRRYFRNHAWGNATLAQFLDALQEGSGRDLHAWARLWLETPSLNTVSAAWRAEGGKVASLRLTQAAPPEHPTLRPHAIDVALVREEAGCLAVHSLAAGIEGAETDVPAASGLPAPRLVFPNHNDHGYMKVLLDAASLDFVKGHLERVEDPLLRQLVWQSLWQMVRDRRLRATDYLVLVSDKIGAEKTLELVESTLACALTSLARYVPEIRLVPAHRAFFARCRKALEEGAQGDLRIVWTRTLISSAFAPEDAAWLADLMAGKASLPGVTLDQEMRWGIATACSAHGLPDSGERLEAELVRDPSDRGRRAHTKGLSARPDATCKAEAWRRIHAEGWGSLHLTGAAMQGFFWAFQGPLIGPYVDRFFDGAREVFSARPPEFARFHFQALYPAWRVERDTLARSERLLAEVEGKQPVLARMLKEAMDDLARAMACREFAEQASSAARNPSRRSTAPPSASPPRDPMPEPCSPATLPTPRDPPEGPSP